MFFVLFCPFCPVIFVPFGKIGYERDKKDKIGQNTLQVYNTRYKLVKYSYLHFRPPLGHQRLSLGHFEPGKTIKVPGMAL